MVLCNSKGVDKDRSLSSSGIPSRLAGMLSLSCC